MKINRITLREAYQLEKLKQSGISNEEILTKSLAGDTEAWRRLHPDDDFTELVSLVKQDKEAFQKILEEGYKVKFVTFKGLRNLLRLRFGKEETEYELGERGIYQLQLTEEELSGVKQMLSQNWNVLKEEHNDEGVKVTIELV